MPFDFQRADTSIRLHGVLPQTIFPVEISIYSYCTLACSYCTHVDTPIMLPEMRTKRAGDIAIGDEVLGWERVSDLDPASFRNDMNDQTRCWQRSRVLNVFRRVAQVVRLDLENGESIICTPDHRWFTGRNGDLEYMPPGLAPWRALHRIDLPLLPVTPFSRDYMIGYLRGMMEGDGTWMPAGTWRLALKDSDALERVVNFVDALGFGRYPIKDFAVGTNCEKMGFIVFHCGDPVNSLINDFDIDTADYVHGWLGGIYDAEGSASTEEYKAALRISQYKSINPLTYQRIERFLRYCGFGYVGEDKAVRLYGGRAAAARFVQIARPAIRRKQSPWIGSGFKGVQHNVCITAITPIGEAEVASFETSTHNYVAGGCLSRNCYSNRNRDVNGRDLHLKNPTALVLNRLDRYLDSEFSPFGFFLREKYPVCFSNATDPFQRDEKIYHSSEAILKWCRQHEVPLFIQTKGNVLHEEFDRYAPYLIPGKDVVYISITHQDDATRKKIEPGALSIPKRWELVDRLSDHGIPVVVACNPYLRDWVPDIDLFCRTCADHDVLGIWFEVLHLTAAQSQHIPLFYKDTVVAKANLQPVYTLSIIEQFIASCHKHGLDFFPSPRWDAYFHDVAAYPECTSPDVFNGKSLDFNFEILRSIAETSKIYNSPVYFTWADIVAFLSASGVPNPILDTSPFWMPYNTNLRADHRCFRAKLTKRAPFYEILRYFYNHPYKNQNFIWYHPRVGVLFDLAKNLYVSDHDGDLIGIHDPQMTLTSSFTIDQASLDLDTLVRWDVQSWLDEET